MGSVGQGSAKLLLFGEHAAVYGYPALGMALPWSTRVYLEETEGSEWELPRLLPEENRHLRDLLALVWEMFPILHKLGPMRMRIDSDIPSSMGFGSSAALCVAFAKAVVSVVAGKVLPVKLVRELERSIDFVWRLANRAERLFHGKPSGIDTGLSLLGNMQAFRFSGKELPKTRTLAAAPLYLVAGAIPRQGNTKQLVGKLGEEMRSGNKAVRRSIRELGELATGATRLLRKGKKDIPQKLGSLADDAHRTLAGLGLSSPQMDMLLEEGRLAGGSGGKLSGAGGGGAFYLVAPDEETALTIAAALRRTIAGLGLEGNLPVAVIRHGSEGTSLVAE